MREERVRRCSMRDAGGGQMQHCDIVAALCFSFSFPSCFVEHCVAAPSNGNDELPVTKQPQP
mgnify:CR=1 FL=1